MRYSSHNLLVWMNCFYVMSPGFDVDLEDEYMLHWTLELQAPRQPNFLNGGTFLQLKRSEVVKTLWTMGFSEIPSQWASLSRIGSSINIEYADIHHGHSSFCSSRDKTHLWHNYKKKSLQKLTVAYNDNLRIQWRRPKPSSTVAMFVNCSVRRLEEMD